MNRIVLAENDVAVSVKGRRKIDVNGRIYVWYVCADDDSPDFVLHVASQDGQFFVKYHLQKPAHNFVIVVGQEFGGVARTIGRWQRFLCPKWESDQGIVRPGAIRELIDWSLSERVERIEVDWRGHRIEH